MRYLVTPYDGVEQWFKKHNINYDQRLKSLNTVDVAPGDHIMGQLDIQQVKMLNRKRAHYEHLLVELEPDIPSHNITPELLDSKGAKLSKTYISIMGEGRCSLTKRKIKTKWLEWTANFSELERKPIAIWFYTTASLLCFAWFGDMLSGSHLFQWVPYLENDTPNPKQVDLLPTLICFAFYAFFSAQLIRIGKKLLPPIRKIRVTDNKKPRRVLIHTLSDYRVQPEKTPSNKWQITLKNSDGEQCLFTFSDNLQHDIAELTQLEKSKFSWNGTQLLRALSAHIDKIELLVLIGTKPSGNKLGSYQYGSMIKDFLTDYLNPEKTAIQIATEQLDSINVNEAYLSLNQIMERILKETHYSSKNLCVDITGATAAISCASAMSTLHTNAQFQYVTTDGEGKIYQQDLMYMSSPAQITP